MRDLSFDELKKLKEAFLKEPTFKLATQYLETLKKILTFKLKSFKLKQEVFYEKDKQKICQFVTTDKEEDLYQTEEFFNDINPSLDILTTCHELKGILIDITT